MTGDGGFVGKETRKFLEAQNINVVGYDLMDGYDITDAQQLESTVANVKPQRILHLAAIARFNEADKNPKLCYETNVMGTRNVALVAGKFHVPVVYASTGSVYMPILDEPPITEDFPVKGNSVYACSKYLGEEYIREYINPYIILRYAHLYGRDKRLHGLIGGFLERIERGVAPVLYGGAQSNDFCYIKDVARANFLALISEFDKWNTEYNIGTGEELSTEDAGKIICDFAGYKGDIEKRKGRTVDPGRFVYDISKASRMLGFDPEYPFKEGLKDMFEVEGQELGGELKDYAYDDQTLEK